MLAELMNSRMSPRRVFFTVLALSVLFALSCAVQKPDPNSEAIKSMPTTTGDITYVGIGDSTGAGVGASDGGYVIRLFRRIEQRKPGSKLINLCVSGATTGDLLRGQLEAAIKSNPDLVTIGIGINDIGRSVDLDTFASNYETILRRLKNETSARIVVSNVPDISTSTRVPVGLRLQTQQTILQYNKRLEEIASSYGVVVFDVFSVTREELPKHLEYFSEDGFHPSDLGYELWANEMWPTVARTVGVAE
jgi:acyl-CoA thioesterase-1